MKNEIIFGIFILIYIFVVSMSLALYENRSSINDMVEYHYTNTISNEG